MYLLTKSMSARVTQLSLAVVVFGWVYFTYFAGAQERADSAAPQATFAQGVSTHSASNYLLKLSTYELNVGGAPGGGIAAMGSAYVIVSGAGSFYAFREPASVSDTAQFNVLPYQAPMNSDGFTAAANAYTGNSRIVNAGWFRVNDVITTKLTEGTRIVIAYDYWDSVEDCVTIRLSYADVSAESFLKGSESIDWRLLFETSPCVKFKSTGHPFGGMQAGGKMTMSPGKENTLLVAFGDMEFDGVNSDIVFAQDTEVSYGKVFEIDMNTGDWERLSSGHRSPSGLHADAAGRIWLTEHGPQGGDELNQIVRGANYGWPLVTQGTQYETYSWPLSDQQSEHDGFELPTFTWIPSIGISDLVSLKSDVFSVWRGDLLVASLREGTLYRVRVRNNRVHFVEPIPVGSRIRELIETDQGALLLWTDSGSVVEIKPIDSLEEIGLLGNEYLNDWSGRYLFHSCEACHTREPGAAHGIGPNLWNVIGRKIASVPGFSFSPSLAKIGGDWDADLLDKFLEDPQAFSPGNRMAVQGIPNAVDRANLITYIAKELTDKESQDSEAVTIEYVSESAGEVYIAWGVDGWKPLPSEQMPPRTTVWDDKIMHTLMTLVEGRFHAQIRVPADSEVEYGFLILKRRDGSKVSVWDGDYSIHGPVSSTVTVDGIDID